MTFTLTFDELAEIISVMKKCCCIASLEIRETSIVGTIDEFRTLTYSGHGEVHWVYKDGLKYGEANDPVSAVINCYKGADE